MQYSVTHNPSVLFVSLCVGVLSQALAAEPQLPIAAQPKAASSLASTVATTTWPTANVTKTPKATALEAQTRRLRRHGYKPEVHDGTTLFCRKEAVVGSRFESKFCGTAEDIDKDTQDGKDLTETVQRTVIVR